MAVADVTFELIYEIVDTYIYIYIYNFRMK